MNRYRKIILSLAGFFFVLFLLVCYCMLRNSVPDEITITDGSEKELNQALNNSWITWDGSVPTAQNESYQITCKVAGILFLKNISVKTIQPQWIQVSGNAVGIYMETQGILVVDTEEIKGTDGLYHSPAQNIIQPGDYITGCNQKDIRTKEELVNCVKHCQGERVSLKLMREEEPIELTVNPVECKGEDYKLGIWVRDDTQGIGTLTYLDGAGEFGALGHGISDTDLGNLLNIQTGTLYNTEIMEIHKGLKGSPGDLAGLIHYNGRAKLGRIEKNTENGIFGQITNGETLNRIPMEVGYKQEIHLGNATVLCTLNQKVEQFGIKIEKIDYNHQDTNKSMVVEVTDPKLLDRTGGIVQGMSGSPILQDGKWIGAITHVFVNDPARGYGIFAETMME